MSSLARCEIATFRYRVLHVVAQFTRSARQVRLRIDRTWLWRAQIAERFHRLRAHSPDQPCSLRHTGTGTAPACPSARSSPLRALPPSPATATAGHAADRSAASQQTKIEDSLGQTLLTGAMKEGG
jgi:hypothetical protein